MNTNTHTHTYSATLFLRASQSAEALLQKSLIHPQKSPILDQKSPTSPQKPYISAKELHISEQEFAPHNMQKRLRHAPFHCILRHLCKRALYLRKRAPYLRARVCASQYAETLTTRSIPLHLETSLQKSPVSPQKSPVSPQNSPVSPQKSTIYPQKRPMSPQKCPNLCEGALTTRCIPLHLNSTKKHRRKRTCCAF